MKSRVGEETESRPCVRVKRKQCAVRDAEDGQSKTGTTMGGKSSLNRHLANQGTAGPKRENVHPLAISAVI